MCMPGRGLPFDGYGINAAWAIIQCMLASGAGVKSIGYLCRMAEPIQVFMVGQGALKIMVLSYAEGIQHIGSALLESRPLPQQGHQCTLRGNVGCVGPACGCQSGCFAAPFLGCSFGCVASGGVFCWVTRFWAPHLWFSFSLWRPTFVMVFSWLRAPNPGIAQRAKKVSHYSVGLSGCGLPRCFLFRLTFACGHPLCCNHYLQQTVF